MLYYSVRFSTALKLRSVSSKIPKTSTKESSKHNDPDDVESRERSASPRRRGHALKEKLRWSRRLNRKRCAITWAIVLLIGALIGLLVYYFNFVKYAEYYEYGLMKENAVGTVDSSWVYWNQWVTRGPSWGMVTYPATAQLVTLRNLSVGTQDELGISISLTLQYFLRRWDVPALHETYRSNFSQPIINRATDSIKETTPQFDSRAFITDRETVEETMFKAVRWRVEGACCLENCGQNDTRPCKEGCIPRESCSSTDLGVYAEVRHLFLLEVKFPADLERAFLRTVVTNVTRDSVTYSSLAHSVRAETEMMLADIRFQEDRIRQAAEIEANLTVSVARSNYLTAVRRARAQALNKLCERLNVTSEGLKNSLEYSRVLAESDRVHLNVDYHHVFVKFPTP